MVVVSFDVDSQDIDGYNHLNNACYPFYFSRAAAELELPVLKLGYTTFDYLKPVLPDSSIVIESNWDGENGKLEQILKVEDQVHAKCVQVYGMDGSVSRDIFESDGYHHQTDLGVDSAHTNGHGMLESRWVLHYVEQGRLGLQEYCEISEEGLRDAGVGLFLRRTTLTYHRLIPTNSRIVLASRVEKLHRVWLQVRYDLIVDGNVHTTCKQKMAWINLREGKIKAPNGDIAAQVENIRSQL